MVGAVVLVNARQQECVRVVVVVGIAPIGTVVAVGPTAPKVRAATLAVSALAVAMAIVIELASEFGYHLASEQSDTAESVGLQDAMPVIKL